MDMQIVKMTTITLVLTGGFVLGSVPPAIAAPIPINPLVMKTAGQTSVANVRSRQGTWNNDGLVAGMWMAARIRINLAEDAGWPLRRANRQDFWRAGQSAAVSTAAAFLQLFSLTAFCL